MSTDTLNTATLAALREAVAEIRPVLCMPVAIRLGSDRWAALQAWAEENCAVFPSEPRQAGSRLNGLDISHDADLAPSEARVIFSDGSSRPL